MDKQYSKRELDSLFKKADDRADELHNIIMQRMDVFESNTSTSLNNIEEQTTKTNGSVIHLQSDIANLKQWRAFLTGGMAVLTVLVIPLILTLLQAGKL